MSTEWLENFANFFIANITAVSGSGSIAITTDSLDSLPGGPFTCVVWPGADPLPTQDNAEILRNCLLSGSDITCVAADRAAEGSNSLTIVAGMKIMLTMTTQSIVNIQNLLGYLPGNPVVTQDVEHIYLSANNPSGNASPELPINGTYDPTTLQITGNSVGRLQVGGINVNNGDRIAIMDFSLGQSSWGIYIVDNQGSGGAAYVLTRAYDHNTGKLLGRNIAFLAHNGGGSSSLIGSSPLIGIFGPALPQNSLGIDSDAVLGGIGQIGDDFGIGILPILGQFLRYGPITFDGSIASTAFTADGSTYNGPYGTPQNLVLQCTLNPTLADASIVVTVDYNSGFPVDIVVEGVGMGGTTTLRTITLPLRGYEKFKITLTNATLDNGYLY